MIPQDQRLSTCVDPLNKSLTIANVQLDNNGTYYCDVTVSPLAFNRYFVPEDEIEITLYVLEGLLIKACCNPY